MLPLDGLRVDGQGNPKKQREDEEEGEDSKCAHHASKSGDLEFKGVFAIRIDFLWVKA